MWPFLEWFPPCWRNRLVSFLCSRFRDRTKSRIVFKGLRHNRRDNGRQIIELVATYPVLGGIEFLFVAPCCGKRKRKLYFKKDRSGFGCRTCLNLTYKTAQGSRLRGRHPILFLQHGHDKCFNNMHDISFLRITGKKSGDCYNMTIFYWFMKIFIALGSWYFIQSTLKRINFLVLFMHQLYPKYFLPRP